MPLGDMKELGIARRLPVSQLKSDCYLQCIHNVLWIADKLFQVDKRSYCLNYGERCEVMIDHRIYTHNLNSYEIKA